MTRLAYDPKNASSIHNYSKKIINKTIRDFMPEHVAADNLKHKGNLGNLVEKYLFNLQINNANEADFKEAGLELKTTGLKKLKRGGYTPKERLVLSKINYHRVVNEQFDKSHLFEKMQFMLLMFYFYEKNILPIDLKFLKSVLWRMSQKDFHIMERDWKIIVQKIKEGKAHELSEADTMYLGACTKAATSKDRTTQPFSKELAKPRAFAFKQSYLKSIYEEKDDELEPIIKDDKNLDLEGHVSNMLDGYVGKTIEDIYTKLGSGLNMQAKNIRQILVYRMLGVRKKYIEEFTKAGILTKVIRLEKSGVLKESISFPAFKYKDISEQDWEESDFKTTVESEFIFFVFQKHDNSEVFKGYSFWKMPYEDRIEVENTWNDTVNKIQLGQTNFLGISQTRVSHVRPHGRNSQDKDELPNGIMAGKKSFWLNAKYIQNQINLNN